MLTGGWSPFYLWEFTRHYEDARVAFTGYQAQGTPGRQLLDASGDHAHVLITAMMHGDQSDDPDASGFAFHEKEITVPTRWVRDINGFSGHAAANRLLQFARDTDPTAIHLVHGDPGAATHLRDHLAGNTDAEQVALADLDEQITVGRTDAIPDDLDQLKQRCDRLRRELNDLEEDIASLQGQ
jgi:predicted metal-dependent RNase